jgi:hypothetical protein
MTIMGLLSSGPLRRTIHVRGALTYQHEHDVSVQIPGWLDLRHHWRRSFEVPNLEAAIEINHTNAVPPDLAQRVAAANDGADGFAMLMLTPDEAARLADTVAKATPTGFGPAMPILDPNEPRNGVLVPVATIRKQFTTNPLTKENPTMTHFLERSAPDAFRLIKEILDDPTNTIVKFILFEFTRRQGVFKRLDHIKGSLARANTLTDAEIDALANPFAVEIGRRKVSEMREPLINPLPDGPFGLVPLLGQRDDANVVFFAAFVGTDRTRLALDIDELLPRVSDAVLEALGRKPREQAAE